MTCLTLALSFSHTLSTVYRGHRLLHPALCVQEEECEAHRHCDVAGGPARYEQVGAACLRGRGYGLNHFR